jgi:GH24 family phage-related lysozyme (muramidase)/murein DD-endopeptidase MepM/ murein hydrolase activator NlpD
MDSVRSADAHTTQAHIVVPTPPPPPPKPAKVPPKETVAQKAAAARATSSFKPATALSQKGLDLIKEFEGLRLKAYRDPVGVWTIGYGHTGGVKAGQVITQARAEQLLKGDTGWAQDAVRRSVKVPLSQGQFDALTSFTFNLGAGALASSTLVKKLNAKDYAGAQKEFGRWVHAGGQVLAGLVRRRAAEAKMFGNSAPSGTTRPPTTPPTTPSTPPPGGTKKLDYRVRAGDTFSGIAAKYKTTTSALAKLNPQIRDINKINVGQLVHIRLAKKAAPRTPAKTYTVKSGDTFSGIAARNSMSTATLAKLNPQVRDLNKINVGQKLTLRAGSSAPSAPPAAPSTRPPAPASAPAAPPGGKPLGDAGIPNTKGMSQAKRFATYEKYLAQFGDAQSKKDLAAGKRVILALRNDTPMSSGPYRGTYDDRVIVMWKDRSGPHVTELQANTEPNRRWAEPANASSKPVGRLADNQTIRYHKAWSEKFGSHLQPFGNPYAQRDLNRNFKFDKGEQKFNGDWDGRAMFIHRAWATDTGSQGCQTMEEGRFNSFWRALGGQNDFSYVLVNVTK